MPFPDGYKVALAGAALNAVLLWLLSRGGVLPPEEWTDRWGHHVGDTWTIPGGSLYTLRRGSPFPDSQPYYSWTTVDGRLIQNMPILSAAQGQLLDAYTGPPQGIGINIYREDTPSGTYGPWAADYAGVLYAMTNAPAPGV
mgnify:CR=1 FL=1